MIHAIDKEIKEGTKSKLLEMFHGKTRNPEHSTYKKVYSQANLNCRCQRTDRFEQFTANPVEQFQSTIRSVKEASVDNLVSQLSMIKLITFNAPSKMNDVDEPILSGFGRAVILLNVALALTIKFENKIEHRSTPKTKTITLLCIQYPKTTWMR
ncbi:hypothetical protein DAKH74_028800 [Maudiozyma humilis]|uniref:Uncharacterized protein n=1 Tax=Maudiozyma humilis TaxID=51915 RepID=A0AAV5RXC6_MAUHU|nr:hypothetical protein DAKH74_028800 [Kazachstania humilis]